MARTRTEPTRGAGSAAGLARRRGEPRGDRLRLLVLSLPVRRDGDRHVAVRSRQPARDLADRARDRRLEARARAALAHRARLLREPDPRTLDAVYTRRLRRP